MINDEGNIDCFFWANGFMNAFLVFPEIWEALLEDDDGVDIIKPMVDVASQGYGENGLIVEKIPEEVRETTLELMFKNLNIAYNYLRFKNIKPELSTEIPILQINQNNILF